MVEAALRKVSNILTGITAPRTPKVPRALLLILALKDRQRFVVESDHIVHHPRSGFKSEAVRLLVGTFGFGRLSDLHVAKPFQKKGIEYHPIIVQWEYLDGLVGFPSEVKLTPIEEHPLSDKIKTYFPT